MTKQSKQSWETVEYTDNPELPDLEDIEIVDDFLPPPTALVFKEAERQERSSNQQSWFNGNVGA